MLGALPNGMDKFRTMHHELLQRGIYLGPSGYEVGFISAAHSEEDLKNAASTICEVLDINLEEAIIEKMKLTEKKYPLEDKNGKKIEYGKKS